MQNGREGANVTKEDILDIQSMYEENRDINRHISEMLTEYNKETAIRRARIICQLGPYGMAAYCRLNFFEVSVLHQTPESGGEAGSLRAGYGRRASRVTAGSAKVSLSHTCI